MCIGQRPYIRRRRFVVGGIHPLTSFNDLGIGHHPAFHLQVTAASVDITCHAFQTRRGAGIEETNAVPAFQHQVIGSVSSRIAAALNRGVFITKVNPGSKSGFPRDDPTGLQQVTVIRFGFVPGVHIPGLQVNIG
ncbi:hypothetical protein D3C75_967510 [compost metagenome]